MRTVKTRLGAILVLLAAAIAAVFVGAAPANAAVTYNSYFVFQKNSADPTNSTLNWYVYRTDLDPPKLTTHVSWRAGSGNGSKNECLSNQGWLPDGNYSVTYHSHYNGTKIWGQVFALSNHVCSGGSVTRTELFIHSEETVNAGQNCPTSGDDPQCWEGNGDYHSEGCIKLTPSNIADAATYFLAVGNVENHTYSNKLIVAG